MKFNLKTLVAAVALAGASMSAMAGIQAGTGAGGGELFFVAYDSTPGVKASFIKDLGVTFNSFLATPTYSTIGSLNVSSDSNWTTYLGLVGNLSSTKWAVVGNLQDTVVGINNANGSKLLATSASLPTANNGQIASAAGEINNVFLLDVADATPAGINNSYVFDSAVGTAKNWANIEQSNINSKVSFSIANNVGDAANFYQLVRNSNRSTTAGTVSTVLSQASTGYQWQFDGSTVVAAAVPEPETYAMLLAGLAIVGGIARRRRRV